MYADLVGPSGRQPAFEQCDRGMIGVQGPVVGQCVLAAMAHQGHALAIPRIAPDRALDIPGGRVGQAPGQGEIGTIQVARGESRRQGGQRLLGFGDHHHAGGVLVQPVHDAGPAFAADAGQGVAAMGQQRVDEGAVQVARRRMHDQPSRLVEHDQVAVLIQYGKVDRLRLGLCRHRRGWIEPVDGAGPHRVGRLAHHMVAAPYPPLVDQRLDAGARHRADGVREEPVHPQPRRFRPGKNGDLTGRNVRKAGCLRGVGGRLRVSLGHGRYRITRFAPDGKANGQAISGFDADIGCEKGLSCGP